MNPRYTPTTEEVAFCAALEPMHWQPKQRHAIQRRADSICPPADLPAKAEAWAWLIREDKQPGYAPFDAVCAAWPNYVFGATGYTGALGYLCELVEFRMVENARNALIVEMYHAAMGKTP